MVSMTIRHVPDADRDRLAAKAAAAGQSLQEYLLRLVVRAAAAPDAVELLAAHRAMLAESRSRVTTDSILESLRESRR